MRRNEVLSQLRQTPEISVLIIGGGVNGIGLFRDLATQGVDVLLVEKGDFCSGASAASSHMVHGGLRYLENGEFRLVREALKERNLLLQNAPHYVFPQPTTVPIFKRFSGTLNAPFRFLGFNEKPSERGAFIIRMGLIMYDWFARPFRTMPTHDFYSREESLKKRPKLNPEIIATARYYDAWMPSPERICIEMITDTEALGEKAHALNYMAMVRGEDDTATLHDELTGETYEVRPKLVVNAAGPWIDFANRAMQQSTNFIGGTKGSHLVLNHPELHEAVADEEIFFENEDGRIVLCFNLGDKVLIGTTDIPVTDPDVRCTDDEIDYMLNMLKRVFPTIQVTRDHIVFAFSGVRPLPTSDADRPGFISRDHSCKITPPDEKVHYPIYSLIGGKWTTFRAFAEQVADKVLPAIGFTRRVSTEHIPIGGGRGYPKTESDTQRWIQHLMSETGLSEDRAKTLFERYGTRSENIGRFIMAGEDYPLQSKPDYSRREIQFLIEQEKVFHIDDILLRRSLLGMLGYTTRKLIDEIADTMTASLNWTDEQKQAEIQRTTQILWEQNRVSL